MQGMRPTLCEKPLYEWIARHDYMPTFTRRTLPSPESDRRMVGKLRRRALARLINISKSQRYLEGSDETNVGYDSGSGSGGTGIGPDIRFGGLTTAWSQSLTFRLPAPRRNLGSVLRSEKKPDSLLDVREDRFPHCLEMERCQK
jgi:hypothetical protein